MTNKPTIGIGSSGLLVEDGKLLMGLSKKWHQWVIPGGSINFLEGYQDSVVREYLEETGLTVAWERLVDIYEILPSSADFHRVIIYSDVRRVSGTLQAGDDIAELRFFDKQEIAGLYRDNLLTWVMVDVLIRFGWLDKTAQAA